ncbi:DUF6233 domain-containing protein [Kitasatospora sp. NBC_00240]|uniref:DUF6233 domain-containing protein n=1 Tax=Kitasatospora sp. NBC_00240 TaxID=2903567 RepID=UPI00225462B9|nr:DUF6233 domain-containing protein [Kitasatospora sp. NBC_00240]MCX5209834.1 DUF6233 domain-containing protein [Kitasatospora sp. NBC_00240]
MSHPRARVTLPDGQELGVLVLARERAEDGVWWYSLRLVLPGGREVDFRASPPAVQPIPGEDYSTLPGPAATSSAWLLTEMRRAREPVRLLHRADCWLAPAGSRPVSGDEYRALVAAGARACDACLPDRPETWDGQS